MYFCKFFCAKIYNFSSGDFLVDYFMDFMGIFFFFPGDMVSFLLYILHGVTIVLFCFGGEGYSLVHLYTSRSW